MGFLTLKSFVLQKKDHDRHRVLNFAGGIIIRAHNFILMIFIHRDAFLTREIIHLIEPDAVFKIRGMGFFPDASTIIAL